MPTKEWEQAVSDGAGRQTMRRIRKHNEEASARRKQDMIKRLAEEFESAWQQRLSKARERNPKRYYSPQLSLEEYGKLFVLNLRTWSAWVYFQTVRILRGNKKREF